MPSVFILVDFPCVLDASGKIHPTLRAWVINHEPVVPKPVDHRVRPVSFVIPGAQVIWAVDELLDSGTKRALRHRLRPSGDHCPQVLVSLFPSLQHRCHAFLASLLHLFRLIAPAILPVKPPPKEALEPGSVHVGFHMVHERGRGFSSVSGKEEPKSSSLFRESMRV